MTAFANLARNSSFSVPADADGVIYTLNADRSVSAEGMVTMTPAEADYAFGGVDLIINAAPPAADDLEVWEAWLDGRRDEAVTFEVPLIGGVDVAELGALALGVEVSEELNVKRV